MRSRRVGVLGGTFDPIHNGHLAAASEVADRCELDEVVFVPAGQAYHKADSAVSDAEDRYSMTVLATAAHPKFRVSRVDIDRGGATYTVDTLRELRREYGQDAELFFIIGADTVETVLTWKAVDEVFSLATFVAVNRPGHRRENSRLPSHAVLVMVDIPDFGVSSTDCRERVAQGRPIWYQLPSDVVRYIDSRGLYRQESA
ncbi:MAG: nicotinate-nucleotide adenylyltransferase [Stackebrandtia sp.]